MSATSPGVSARHQHLLDECFEHLLIHCAVDLFAEQRMPC